MRVRVLITEVKLTISARTLASCLALRLEFRAGWVRAWGHPLREFWFANREHQHRTCRTPTPPLATHAGRPMDSRAARARLRRTPNVVVVTLLAALALIYWNVQNIELYAPDFEDHVLRAWGLGGG